MKIQMITTTPKDSTNRWSRKYSFVLVALACVALLPTALAQNTSYGVGANPSNTGTNNTAFGFQVLNLNTTGGDNTATGWKALAGNKNGSFNTATGLYSLEKNVAGNKNTAAGWCALYMSTGNFNIGLGPHAGYNLFSGDNNIYIGNEAPNTGTGVEES